MELQPIRKPEKLRFKGGERVGSLTVVRPLGSKHFGCGVAVVFECRCDCGMLVERDRQTLIRRPQKTCGSRCRMNVGTAPEGCSSHPLHKRWWAMLDRCFNPQNKSHPDYGARGVTVCQRWRYGEDDLTGFECFAADMGDPGGLTLERKDSAGNYEPNNCIWATRTVQGRNRRCVRLIEWNGESLPISVWAERTGINYFTLMRRFKAGWPVERALTEAIHPR